jgi:hypothetical protein
MINKHTEKELGNQDIGDIQKLTNAYYQCGKYKKAIVL